PGRTRAARDRLSRRGAARGRAHVHLPADEPRRDDVRLEIAGDRRARRHRRRAARPLPVRRTGRYGADPAALAVPVAHLRRLLGHRIHHRHRALRSRHLPAAVPADRPRAEPDELRPAAHADDGGAARHLDRERPAHLQDGALPAVPDRGHRHRDRRHGAAGAAERPYDDGRDVAVHARPRSRPRDGHASARPRRAERRAAERDGRRHVGLDHVPADRRLGGQRRLRRNLREPPARGPRRDAAPGLASAEDRRALDDSTAVPASAHDLRARVRECAAPGVRRRRDHLGTVVRAHVVPDGGAVAADDGSRGAGMIPELELLDWRGRVFDLYAHVRASEPRAGWARWREVRAELFRDHPQSPSPGYTGLSYFDYDPAFRFLAEVQPVEEQVLEIAGSAGSLTRFRRFAVARFELGALELYWLEAYGGGVFLPFADETRGTET